MSIRDLINTPLSDDQALHLANGLPMSQPVPDDAKYKVYSYDEIINLQIPEPGCGFILLYLENPSYGHFCAVKNYGDRLAFFDPLGIFIDKQILWYDKGMNKKLNQDRVHLSNMFKKWNGTIEYNDKQYMRDFKYDQTCGRQCGIFLLLSDKLSMNQYRTLMEKASKNSGLTIPEIVTKLSKNILYPK